jgi:hypothetical protein
MLTMCELAKYGQRRTLMKVIWDQWVEGSNPFTPTMWINGLAPDAGLSGRRSGTRQANRQWKSRAPRQTRSEWACKNHPDTINGAARQ